MLTSVLCEMGCEEWKMAGSHKSCFQFPSAVEIRLDQSPQQTFDCPWITFLYFLLSVILLNFWTYSQKWALNQWIVAVFSPGLFFHRNTLYGFQNIQLKLCQKACWQLIPTNSWCYYWLMTFKWRQHWPKTTISKMTVFTFIRWWKDPFNPC